MTEAEINIWLKKPIDRHIPQEVCTALERSPFPEDETAELECFRLFFLAMDEYDRKRGKKRVRD